MELVNNMSVVDAMPGKIKSLLKPGDENSSCGEFSRMVVRQDNLFDLTGYIALALQTVLTKVY